MILKRISGFSFFPFLLLLTLFTPRPADDGFNWQTVEAGMLKVHWYEGDAAFGQQALATAQAGQESIVRLVPASLDRSIQIFIYSSSDDLQGALAAGKQNWMAGHADPETGVVQVLVAPGPQQGIAMEQRIPHELMHVMLYRRIGPGYKDIPAWLREGMATLVELYPNSDYERVLQAAAASDTLIPLQDLCVSFPDNPSQAFLAYAESRSFTGYLLETYGATGLLDLAASYADGLDCQRGSERAFGLPLSNLEQKWLASVLGKSEALLALQTISPYLVLLCLVLIIPMIGIAGALRKGTSHEAGTYVRK
jgi:hypothetical protein